MSRLSLKRKWEIIKAKDENIPMREIAILADCSQYAIKKIISEESQIRKLWSDKKKKDQDKLKKINDSVVAFLTKKSFNQFNDCIESMKRKTIRLSRHYEYDEFSFDIWLEDFITEDHHKHLLEKSINKSPVVIKSDSGDEIDMENPRETIKCYRQTADRLDVIRAFLKSENDDEALSILEDLLKVVRARLSQRSTNQMAIEDFYRNAKKQ